MPQTSNSFYHLLTKQLLVIKGNQWLDYLPPIMSRTPQNVPLNSISLLSPHYLGCLLDQPLVTKIISGADTGFSVGGGANPPGGRQTYKFARFSQKLHEIKKILVRRGGAPPLDPPLHPMMDLQALPPIVSKTPQNMPQTWHFILSTSNT